jgi:hypothetical protein
MLKFYSKPKRHDLEAALQRAVCQHLTLNGAPGMMFLKIANEGKRSVAMGAEMKRQGLKPGAADLLIIVNGKPYFLELKRRGESPTDLQVAFGNEALDCGADYAWSDNIDDALKHLRRWGAIA